MPDGSTLYELTIGETAVEIGGRSAKATTINGTVPGPLLRFQQGREVTLRVSNRLKEDTSIHWHGILLPANMDGVPGLSFAGIRPGETFEYRFKLQQYGTYWYHSHSGLQEQLGHYGPLIVAPAERGPFRFDREHFVVLSDWTFENPYRVLSKLKKQPDYYNFQRRTVGDLFRDVAKNGFFSTLRDRAMWANMRMNPTDIADLTGAAFTYLVNGLAPSDNWTGLFKPGERVLLHVINASAATFFDVRIPGLPMTVVESNGQHVKPVETDEIRIAIAETYSVLVEPKEDRAYTVFAEAMDRSGYARGTLAPRVGMAGALPARRKRPILTMADMGMQHGEGSGHEGHGAGQPTAPARHVAHLDGRASQPSGHEGHGQGHPAEPSGHEGHTGVTAHRSSKHEEPGQTKTPSRTAAPSAPPPSEHAGHHGHGQPNPSASAATQQSQQEADSQADRGANARLKAAEDGAKEAVAGAIRTTGLRAPGTIAGPLPHERSTHGVGNAAVPSLVQSRLTEPGIGLGQDGWRVLTYADLRALHQRPSFAAPTREIEIHLTGNMERFMWSLDGVPFERSQPVRLTYGERIRLTMVNDTMMNHPMHLHGMWMELENGHGELIPRVHTINVKPAERLSLLVTADAPGRWAFHCHVLYHMEVGMFRVFEVSAPTTSPQSEGHRGS